MTVKAEVLSFFEKKGLVPGATEEEKLCCQYLEERLLDSMGIVDMVTQFESEFNIRFTPEDLQSEDFRSIGGLVKMIDAQRRN